MTKSELGINGSRARVPALLRYRGLEREALMAARLANVETLVAAIQPVLDDLRSALGERLDPRQPTAGGSPRGTGDQGRAGGLEAFPLRHLELVEAVLETALAHVRRAGETAGLRD